LQQFRRDEKWLARASEVVRQFWHAKNARQQKKEGAESRGE